MTNFTRDLDEFQGHLAAYLADVPASAWNERTGPREKDWTLHETLAHLVAIGEAFNLSAQAALHQTELIIPNLTQRQDLRAMNDSAILSRREESPQALQAQLWAVFDVARQLASQVTPENAHQEAWLRVYSRPCSLIDFLDWQLSHAGVIHAAQITRPLHRAPLWEAYSGELLHRQLGRFMRHFSIAYWPEYGPQETQTLNFHIGGPNGGQWHITAEPAGGFTHHGLSHTATHELHFASPQVFFGMFTIQLNVMQALGEGLIRIEGDALGALALIKLFAPMPPNL